MAVDSRGPPDRDRLYLGWQYALAHPHPGPAPKRPTPPRQHEVDPAWMETQRRVEDQLNRPLQLAGALALAVAGVFGVLGWPLAVVPSWGAAAAIGMCLVLAAVTAYAVWQGERALRVRLAEERERLERLRADRDRRVHAAQQEHAREFDAWRARKSAHDAQHTWYAVTLPPRVRRLDVIGGVLSGWQALVATIGATCLDTGREVTVADLTGGAVASDLLELAGPRDSRVWTIPEDPPRLESDADHDTASARLRVLSLARRGGSVSDTGLGHDVATMLVRELRGASEREPRSAVLLVCGAERLRGEVLDRLHAASADKSARLVMMYRSMPAHVRERLGGGESAVAFMRLGDIADARLASEEIGPESRLVLSRFTENVSAWRPETAPGTSRENPEETERGTFGDGEGQTLTRRAATATSWGRRTAQALGGESLRSLSSGSSGSSRSRTVRQSREFPARPGELRRLPRSAFVLCRDAPAGRLVCGDANPAIASLPEATYRDLEDAGQDAAPAEPSAEPSAGPAEGSAPADVPPNLGAPPERLDWRTRRRA